MRGELVCKCRGSLRVSFRGNELSNCIQLHWVGVISNLHGSVTLRDSQLSLASMVGRPFTPPSVQDGHGGNILSSRV